MQNTRDLENELKTAKQLLFALVKQAGGEVEVDLDACRTFASGESQIILREDIIRRKTIINIKEA